MKIIKIKYGNAYIEVDIMLFIILRLIIQQIVQMNISII